MSYNAFPIGHLNHFKLHSSDWSIYKAKLNNYFTANDITNNEKKKAIFLTLLDEEAYRLMLYLSHPSLPEDNSFETLVSLFDRSLTPKNFLFTERSRFYKAKKHRSESIDDWASRVQHLATNCHFGDMLDVCLRDKFIFGFGNDLVFQFLENADASFEEAVKMAKEKIGDNCYSGFQGHGMDNSDYDLGSFFYDRSWCMVYPCVVLGCCRYNSH